MNRHINQNTVYNVSFIIYKLRLYLNICIQFKGLDMLKSQKHIKYF